MQCTQLRTTQNQAGWETRKEAITKAELGTVDLECLCQQSDTIALKTEKFTMA